MTFRKYCRGMSQHEIERVFCQRLIRLKKNSVLLNTYCGGHNIKKKNCSPCRLHKKNLPGKVKPCSGPLVKIVSLLSACKASSLIY